MPRATSLPSRPSTSASAHAIAVGVVARCNATLNEFEWYRRNSRAVASNDRMAPEKRAQKDRGSMRARCAREVVDVGTATPCGEARSRRSAR